MTMTGLLRSDRVLRASAMTCLVALGTFLIWSAFAPLAEGITAYGKVAVENERQVVQHLEGGIIDTILVREGQRIKAGERLIVLTDIPALSGRDQTAEDYVDAQASIARLRALSASETSLTLPAIDNADVPTDRFEEIVSRQSSLFSQQRLTHAADIEVLRSRRDGFARSGQNTQNQINSIARSLAIVRADLAEKRGLLAERLIRAAEVTQLERDEAGLSGDMARLRTEQVDDRSQVIEIDREIAQTRARFDEKVSSDLLEGRTREAELRERLTAMRDVVSRTVITAPVAGTILNLKFATTGGVVRAGEPIMEIVPTGTALVATVEIRPVDRDTVYEGLKVKTRLSGLKSWSAPSLDGEVSQVSADLKTSPDGDYSYYEARVIIAAEDLAELDDAVLPGMPVEAFIFSGTERTFLDYLLEPITATLRRGARS